MWVRQKIGREAGAIVEMPYGAAQAALASGTVGEVTDEELQKAGFPSQASMVDVPTDVLLADYRIEPNPNGGYDIFDAGGVPLNEKPIHNLAAARDQAHNHARAGRGLPPAERSMESKIASGEVMTGEGVTGEVVDYEAMSKADLEKMAADRGVDFTGVHTKAEQVAMMQRTDKVKAAVAARDYDVLTRPELEKLAGERRVDISHAKSKADIVAAMKK